MSIPRLTVPPKEGGNYIIPQLEGEIISIPGSKSVFRILTSSLQNGRFSVFSSDGALADAPGFHHHNHAHDIFMVTEGFLQVWNGDQCRILGPGDFASVPPGTIHNPKLLGPVTKTWGVITPAEWVDFFRYVSESYDGILYPENDDRDLKSLLIPKVIGAAKQGKDFDVHFHRDHVGAEVSDWGEKDSILPESTTPYYLRANTGPRWMLGGVMSRPFITTRQSEGKFAISSIESSSTYGSTFLDQHRWRFPDAHHMFVVFEGDLEVEIDGAEPTRLHQGETIFITKDVAFSLRFRSKFVRVWSFSTGNGIESIVHEAGSQHQGYALPDKAVPFEGDKLQEAATRIGAHAQATSNGTSGTH